MKKHLVIDARHLNTSTGIYMQNLLHEIDALNPAKLRISALVPSSLVDEWSKNAPHITFIGADQAWYSLAEQLSLARQLYRLKPDLVHFCMPQQPVFYFGKRVTTIHDLTLVHYENVDINPLIYRLRKTIFSTMLKNVTVRSKAIFTPTKYTRDDLIKFTSEKFANKIIVTLEAGDPLAAKSEPIAKLRGKKFLFFVGNAFPYKNLDRIVAAYKQLKTSHPELELVFAGRKDEFYEKIQRTVDAESIPDVHILGFVSEGEKRWLFQNAACYVVASLSEGFHIPGLEAMYEQCPVVSADASCLPEVYGSAALYFNPRSTSSLALAITQVLEDKQLRKKLINAGDSQVQKYSWKKMVQETLVVYEKVLSKS